MSNPFTWAWGKFVITLAGPAEDAATRQGITGGQDRNAFAHAYTAAAIVYNDIGSWGNKPPAFATDNAYFLGRMKENLPGYLGMNEFRDYYKDMWNNSVGFDIGSYARTQGLSFEELERLVANALRDNALIRSDKPGQDSRIPADPTSNYHNWPIPIPPHYNPGGCFLAGTLISAENGYKIPIENISIGSEVVSFDHKNNLGQKLEIKRVKRIFHNICRQIVELRGTYCTPGHVFLTGDRHVNGHGRFDTIAHILCDDSTLVEHDATVIRARTGAKLGHADDALVSVIYCDPPLADQPSQERRAIVRAGIPLPPVMIKDALAPDQSLAQHLADHDITPLADGRLRTPDGTIHDACNWPEGTTPFDTHEARNWIVQADGVPYCPPWIRDLVAEDETESLRVVGALSA